MPAYVAASPPNTLAAMYRKNSPGLSCFKRLIPSSVNAEKVVNPPQNPVISNSFQFSAEALKRPQKIPINKQPAIFTIHVLNG